MNHRAYAIPSPFPHLPSTAQELIRMYLEIVGVRPDDSYTVEVTEDGVRSIDGHEQKAGGLVSLTTNSGDSLPCADGESRKRLAGGKIVVIAYAIATSTNRRETLGELSTRGAAVVPREPDRLEPSGRGT